MPGTLVICPTPLGNLGDMTIRALEALRGADCICCEDTRVTARLLAALGIEGVRLERLDEQVMGRRAAHVVERVLAGEAVVYCSDAGMPGVSDPGQRLVAAAREAGASVEVLPGPSAAVTAYVASGFVCPRYYFGGFFPRKDAERARVLEALRCLDAVAVFYESPERLPAAVQAVARVLPDRRVAVCRELTKAHEEVVTGAAPELARCFAERQQAGQIRGEVVLVIDAPPKDERAQAAAKAEQLAAREACRLSEEGLMSNKDIVAHLQASFGVSRNVAYRLVHGTGAAKGGRRRSEEGGAPCVQGA